MAPIRTFSPMEYRKFSERARRWAQVCETAGQTVETLHQITEAARFATLADEIEQETRKAA